MDTIIDGLNKVVCRTDVVNNGETVTIGNGTCEWTSQVVEGVATFLIPSVPAPAKTSYTVTLGEYSRTIELGFGDSIDITLDEEHEPAMLGHIAFLQNEITALQGAILTAQEVTAVRSLLASLQNKNLVSASANGTTLYLTSINQ